MENWKTFKKSKYAVWEISDWGNIRKNGRPYTPYEKGGKPGNRYYTLSINEPFGGYVHRIVANYFLPNPYGHLTVNHKDGNKRNNHVDNLEWVSYSTQIHHAFDKQLNTKVAETWDRVTPYKEYIENRRARVVELRALGWSLKKIAAELETYHELVYADLKAIEKRNEKGQTKTEH